LVDQVSCSAKGYLTESALDTDIGLTAEKNLGARAVVRAEAARTKVQIAFKLKEGFQTATEVLGAAETEHA